MACYAYGNGYSFLHDSDRCWANNINLAFDGKLSGCFLVGVPWANQPNCQTTAENINKDPRYKGPPIRAIQVQDFFTSLGWGSEVNCTKGINAMMEVMGPWCNAGGCIPQGQKRKDGQRDCCTEGRESLKCPGPAYYQCGV